MGVIQFCSGVYLFSVLKKMKRFYWGIILFVLPIVVFFGGAELAIRSQPNIYKYKKAWMDQHAEEVETLIIGNSFALGGVIPDSIGKNSFNLAFGGEPLIYDHFLFFKWTDYYKHLKTFIHFIDYKSFYEGSYGLSSFTKDDIQETTYKIYMGSKRHSDFSFYSLESRHFKVVSEKLRRKLSEDYDFTENYRGWQPSSPFSEKLAETFDRENKKYARKQTVPSYEKANENIRMVEEEAEWCQSHGVRFVLVFPPFWKKFNSLLSKRQIAKNKELIEDVKRRYSITFLDYREDDRFVETDFNDRRHLTVCGAKKFSGILARDLKIRK